MDAHIKAGEVYLQPRKAGKKWKQVWMGLYPPRSNAVGRLEIQNATWGGAGGEVWRHQQTHGDKKIRVVRLSDVLSVRRLPPHAEACPKENMSAFCVETEERTMVFAAARDDSIDWVSRLCAVAFQRGSSPLHMEKNQIYVSTEEVCQFSVLVQQTEAAMRCGLQGAYWLQVGEDGLTLREAEKKSSVLTWPYALLRRYGKDKLSLSIEAGRRCDSGPGTFTFKTGQNDDIFSLMELAMKRQRVPAAAALSVGQEAEKATMTTNRCPRSPLPKIPDAANMAAILDNKLRVDVGPVDSTLESPYSTPADSIVCGGPNSEPQPSGRNPGQAPAPITLQPLPPIATHHAAPAVHRTGQSEPLYADPVDCRSLTPKEIADAKTAVYVDPATILPLKPPASATAVPHIINYGPTASVPSTMDPHHLRGAVVVGSGSDLSPPDPVYSEVYSPVADRLRPIVEPIYTEPMPRKTETKTQQPDPFAHLYAQVCKPKPSSATATSSSSSTSPSSSATPPPLSCTSSNSGVVRSAGDCSALSDVIYENLGVI